MHATIADVTDDLVLYRDLEPCDGTLPGLSALRGPLGIAPGVIPRKRERDYARVVLGTIEAALAQRGAGSPRSFLVLGDTENDRQFTTHLRAASGLPTVGFIGHDDADPPSITWDGDTATANRWSLLDAVLAEAVARGVEPGPGLVVLLDIDKTLLGPRGRNDGVIDESRLGATLAIGEQIFGSEQDATALEATYRTLCNPVFHPFTLDNQDIVVYTALLIMAGVVSLADIRQRSKQGDADGFEALLAQTARDLPPALGTVHRTVQAAVAAGDPTSFKAFRSEEFRIVVELMATGELTLCAEVLTAAQRLREAGALCMAASDKPGEASLPSPAQAAAGLLPLHRTPALVR